MNASPSATLVPPSSTPPRTRVPRANRLMIGGLAVVTTLAGLTLYIRTLTPHGVNVVEGITIPLFAVLFGWIAFSFWTATAGLLVTLAERESSRSAPQHNADPTSRVAVLMPVYNESPLAVFAGVKAMIESVRETGFAPLFDFYILSDSTNPDVWLDEERAWSQLTASLTESDAKLFYRHRPENTCRKSGNIEDFCHRWGSHYPFMTVLDADSIMSGETMIEMVRRMEADPQLGILQVPPTPVNRKSVFARWQQFAAQFYAAIFINGFRAWAGPDSNYWGHNAIIRVEPFIQHCRLPILPGQAPLGGEILSHDFVEAALMSKAGYRVQLASDLVGSYEECPTTLADYAQRDHRWCQGNMQHLRLIVTEGFRPLSRWHFTMGVMSYLSSPLWFLFMTFTLLAMALDPASPASSGGGSALTVFVLTMTLLLLPKFYAVVALAGAPRRRKLFGGWIGAVGSVLLETVISALVAPLMLYYHTRFVVSVFSGMNVKWSAQNRDEKRQSLVGAIANAVRTYWPQTLVGVAAAVLVFLVAPDVLPWFVPVLAGLLLAVPLTVALDSVPFGKFLARWNLFLIPEEKSLPPVLAAHRSALTFFENQLPSVSQASLFDAVIRDPKFHLLHRSIQEDTGSNRESSPAVRSDLLERWESTGSVPLTPADRKTILLDPTLLGELHIRSRERADAVTPATSG